MILGNTIKRTNSEQYWPCMKGEIKQYAHMSVRYTDESVKDDQSINPTNSIVRRTLVVNNKDGGGNTYFIKSLIS